MRFRMARTDGKRKAPRILAGLFLRTSSLECNHSRKVESFRRFAFGYSKSGDSVVRVNFTTKEFAIEKEGTRDFVMRPR